ncbi:MAG: ASCH/PUA domain-containing protein [Armatimonadota bacterium]
MSETSTVAGQMHELKIWPEYFEAIRTGKKTFEVRKDDRGFQVGDLLLLREWDPETKTYSGRALFRDVSYVLRLEPGDCVVMSLTVDPDAGGPRPATEPKQISPVHALRLLDFARELPHVDLWWDPEGFSLQDEKRQVHAYFAYDLSGEGDFERWNRLAKLRAHLCQQAPAALIALAEENERLRKALETFAAPDMWEQVEGEVFGPDCPDGHNDPLIWLGAEDPIQIARAALAPPEVPAQTLHVWEAGDYGEKIVAASAEHAAEIYTELTGEAAPSEEDQWEQLPDDHVITITYPDEPRGEDGEPVRVSHTAAEWANNGEGPRFLCLSSDVC